MISFRTDWLDLLAVQGCLKSFLQYHSSKASIPQCSASFMVQLSLPYVSAGSALCICISPPPWISLLLPIPPCVSSQSTTISCLCVRQLPTGSYLHGVVYAYMSVLLSQFVPLLPPDASTSLPSTPVPLFLPCTRVHQHHFSRFHIYDPVAS